MLLLSSISSNRLQTFIATTISSATLQLSTNNNNNHTNNNSYDQNISIPPSLLTCSHDRGNIVALFNFANLFFTPIFMYGLLSLLMMKLYHRRYGLLCFLGALLLLLCEICDSVDISLDVIIYRRILGTNSGSGSGSGGNRAAIAYIVYSILFDIVKYLSLTLGFLLLFFGSYYAVYFHHRNHGMSSVSDEEDDTGGMGQSRINHMNGNNSNGHSQSGGDDGDNNRSRSSSSGSSNSDMVMHEINLRFNDQYRHRESIAHIGGGAASMIHGQFGMKTKQFQRTMWRRRLCRIIVPIVCLVIIAFCTIGIGLLIDVLVLYPKYKKEQARESATTSSIASSMHASSTLRDTSLLTDKVPQHDHHSDYRMTSGDLSSSLLSSSLTPTLLSPPETDRTNQQQDETQHLSSTDSTMIDMSTTMMMMMNTQANNGTVSDNTVTVKPELWKTSLIISVILFQLGIGVVLIWLCFHFISSRSALVIASSLYALCIVSQIVSTILFALEDFAAYHNGVWCMAFRYFRIAANFVSFLLFVLPSLLVFIGVRRHNRNVESYRHLTERFLDQVPVRPKSRETRRFSSSTINGFNYDIDEEYMT